MKLIIQIALGVFLGTITAQLSIDSWRNYQDFLAKEELKKQQAEQEKVRLEQAQRIREMFQQSQKNNPTKNKPPEGFIPDDSQMEQNQED